MSGHEAWARAHELQVTGRARFHGSANGATNAIGADEERAAAHALRVGIWRDKVRPLTASEFRAKERACFDFLAWAEAEPSHPEARRWLWEARALCDALAEEALARLTEEGLALEHLFTARRGDGPEAA